MRRRIGRCPRGTSFCVCCCEASVLLGCATFLSFVLSGVVVGHSWFGGRSCRILVILIDCSDLACCDGLFVCFSLGSVLLICCCCCRRLLVVVSYRCSNDYKFCFEHYKFCLEPGVERVGLPPRRLKRLKACFIQVLQCVLVSHSRCCFCSFLRGVCG